MLEFKYIVSIVAGLIFLGIAASIPFRRNKIKASSGEMIMPLASSSVIMFAGFFICAAVIAVLPFRNFAPYLYVVLAAVADIASEIAAREAASFRLTGLYQNSIIWGIYNIPYGEIYSLPTISYENDEDTVGVDFNYLDIILTNNKQIQMFFKDRAQRDEALKVILQKRPDLK